ncbi:CHAT domain-containing protein [Ramlibacter sp. USB13]|uniref:CHAT domain-containing protein n=1 Tax=Ramlibacter cellulosilyticus TaxID=2764187 RepID=A0A923SD13_9BURK|nr:CHAT domain-containing protein [Ramlibacter cellulosilyticus]MBC5785546.1 CHAT domain-containing protein [Ramlibacter cellulosilyticus]
MGTTGTPGPAPAGPAPAGREFTFELAGEEMPAVRGRGGPGAVRQAVRLASTRGDAKPVTVKARTGEHVVRLAIANGPTLILAPDSAHALLAAQRRDKRREASAANGPVVVTPQLAWRGPDAGATRGFTDWLGQATLESFEVLGDVAPDISPDLAEEAAARVLAQKLDAQVVPGLYRLKADRFDQSLKDAHEQPLPHLQPPANGQAILVLVHGTFVESHGTFGKLWTAQAAQVRRLFERYGEHVYAFDHPTLGASPVANALALAKALPAGTRLHLLTHSRGGLVAEVLARACSGVVPARQDLDALVPDDAADLEKLFAEARGKGLRVDRMVRVACPARGTLLASRRLDAYLSILTWALQLGGQQVAGALVDFLHGIAKKRADPKVLPGLRAMMPDSEFIRWLAAQAAPIEGDLRVVAGDMQGDSVLSWVKTLLADAFYWTDNDLVVHTRAMYGGVPRGAIGQGGNARFLLDRGGKVSHFNYFSNVRTATAVVDALVQDAPAGFDVIGRNSWAGLDASGTRGARAIQRSAGSPAAPAASRPAVFVLPGILGSNIRRDDERIWIGWNFIDGLVKLAWTPETAGRFHADGPVADVYDGLIERLADTHEVIAFAFDWRRPIEDEAERLADAVDAALAARSASGQPVRLLAHSMGSLVARTMRLQRRDTWDRMMRREGARLVMLGPPNGGSWAPMQVLTGDDGFGNALVAFGALFRNAEARAVLAGLPGLMQLQAGLNDPQLQLHLASTWADLAKKDIDALLRYNAWHQPDAQRAVYGWSAPPQAVLERAAALRARLDEQLQGLHADASRMAIVVGRAGFTPAGYALTDAGLEYVAAPEGGDGRVPHRSAQLPGVPMWQVDAPHGKLPETAEAFAAYLELLTDGSTKRLPRMDAIPDTPVSRERGGGTQRSALAPAHSRPSRRFEDVAPPASPSDLMDAGAARERPANAQALAVRVVNGDLQFVPEPLLVGHYRSLQLTGSEKIVDKLVDGGMARSIATGLYPDAVGTHQVFANERRNPKNPLQMARPTAAVVVGLGEEGKLTADKLAFTIRQAVLAFAQRIADEPGAAPATFELSATLVGSGGMRITPGTAAQYVSQGVIDANEKLATTRGWPRVARLTLVELFLERATEAWHALRQQQAAWGGRLRLDGQVEVEQGAMRRSLDAGYRSTTYDFISALSQRDASGNVCIAYDLDTRRARTEVRAQHAQTGLVRELVATASNQANTDPLIGRTLFNLLVPAEIEPYLAGTNEMVLEVDAGTAVIPWELLKSNPDAMQEDTRPWAVRSRLVRKLRTENFRERVMDATPDDAVLVIGEPAAPSDYPPLEGAKAEAEAVIAHLDAQRPRVDVSALVDNNDARTIINELFARSYRIIHVAGHGAPGPEGGVVLSGNTFLGAKEVAAMRTVPELVFLNCCHLAHRDVKDLGRTHDRARFAANIAEKLIEAGVRCVIAAGWAVEDGPAEVFATRFYDAVLAGARFIDAVGAAREAAWRANPNGNTWAAYQCYGDPTWSWRRSQPSEREPVASREEGPLASAYGVALALENLVTEVRFGSRTPQAALDRVRALESEHAARWGAMGSVAEAFGLAYVAAEAPEQALAWLERAIAAEDGGATLRAAEQLANLRARHGEKSDDLAAVRAGMRELRRLVHLHPTHERMSLLGSACKRLSMVAWRQGDAPAAARAAANGAKWYLQAQERATAAGALDVFYPARAALICEIAAALMQKRAPEITEERLQAVEAMTRAAATARPDFWSVAGVAELQMLKALRAGSVLDNLDGVLAELRDLQERVPSADNWDSVHAEARFVLLPYLAREPGEDECSAVQELLDILKGYAGTES